MAKPITTAMRPAQPGGPLLSNRVEPMTHDEIPMLRLMLAVAALSAAVGGLVPQIALAVLV